MVLELETLLDADAPYRQMKKPGDVLAYAESAGLTVVETYGDGGVSFPVTPFGSYEEIPIDVRVLQLIMLLTVENPDEWSPKYLQENMNGNYKKFRELFSAPEGMRWHMLEGILPEDLLARFDYRGPGAASSELFAKYPQEREFFLKCKKNLLLRRSMQFLSQYYYTEDESADRDEQNREPLGAFKSTFLVREAGGMSDAIKMIRRHDPDFSWYKLFESMPEPWCHCIDAHCRDLYDYGIKVRSRLFRLGLSAWNIKWLAANDGSMRLSISRMCGDDGWARFLLELPQDLFLKYDLKGEGPKTKSKVLRAYWKRMEAIEEGGDLSYAEYIAMYSDVDRVSDSVSSDVESAMVRTVNTPRKDYDAIEAILDRHGYTPNRRLLKYAMLADLREEMSSFNLAANEIICELLRFFFDKSLGYYDSYIDMPSDLLAASVYSMTSSNTWIQELDDYLARVS